MMCDILKAYREYMTYLSIITPTNLAQEKERFFTEPNYEPQLEYDWSDERIQTICAKRPSFAELAHALPTQDANVIERAAMEFFDVQFLPEHIELAKNIVAQGTPDTTTTPDELAAAFERAIEVLDIGYTVEIVDKHGFRARPKHRAKKVTVSKHTATQFMSAECIAVHEMIHCIRAVNGEYNGIKKASNYLPTEEGLACVLQDYYSANGGGALYQHALEYMAAYKSRTASFTEVHDFLVEHGCSKEMAWDRGIRQKFGMKDTGKPGSLCKSGMYFYHMHLLKALPLDSLFRLLVGKISADNLEQYPKYTGVIPLKKIQELLAL